VIVEKTEFAPGVEAVAPEGDGITDPPGAQVPVPPAPTVIA
jgi:hypothetical protein